MIDTEARLARIERILLTLMWDSARDLATLEANVAHPLSSLGLTVDQKDYDALEVSRSAMIEARFPEVYRELFGEDKP